MSWQEIVGHDAVVERFRRMVASRRLASTFLFVGPAGIGKRTFALKLAQALLCETNPESVLDPCGKCPACQQVTVQTHPDVAIVRKPDDKNFIPLELLIGDDQHRLREGLCHDISLKPFQGGRKIAIIDDADHLNQEGANCLLKTLEEPPPKSVIMLIGTSEQRQLPTIRSRAQVIRFHPLTRDSVKQLLLRHELVESESEADELAQLSDGSLQQALELTDPTVREFRQRWLQFLATPGEHAFLFSKELSTFVDAAGKEAPPRRIRLHQVARWGTDFYRHMMSRMEGHTTIVDAGLDDAINAVMKQPWLRDAAAVNLERCIDVQGQIDANANLATLTESWLDDLVTQSHPPRAIA